MKRMKKFFAVLLCMAVIAGMSGCSSVNSGKRIVRISHAQSETHPHQRSSENLQRKCGNDRYYHFPDWCIQHYVLGYGIYQYSDSCIKRTAGNQ